MTELVLEGYGALELSGETQVPITYDINDIRILGNRNGAWSKTIKVPGTNRNNEILGNVFSINISTFDFDPLKKVNVIQIVDGQVIFRGIFQLRKIGRNYTSPTEYKIEYDCTVKNDASSLFSILSGKRLDEVDLSQYDHFFTQALVTDSVQGGNWTNGYQYFLGYNGFETGYWGRNFIPAVYARTYLDKIMQDAGFVYEFPEIDEINFNNLIIPYNAEYFSPAINRKYLFRAGNSNVSIYDLAVSQVIGNFDPLDGLLINTFVQNTLYPPVRMTFDIDSPQPFFDSSSAWDTTLYEYDLQDFAGTMDFTVRLKGTIGLNLNCFACGPGGGSQFNPLTLRGDAVVSPIIRIVVYDANGFELGVISQNQMYDLADSDTTWTSSNTPLLFTPGYNACRDVDFTYSGTFSTQLFPSASKIAVTFDPGPASNFVDFLGTNEAQNQPTFSTAIQMRLFTGEENFIFNSASSEIYEGTEISMNRAIPAEYKQSEFLLDLAKIHNLYVYQDPVEPKRVIIKTRDRFYADGEDIVWDDKIDMSTVDIDFLSNSQNKIKKLTYAQDDNDVLLKAYQEQTRETYGQLRYVFENEFSRDTDEMSTVFSPTATIFANELYLPYIDSQSPDNNIRILQIGNLLKGAWEYVNYTIANGLAAITETPYSFYRHAGMVWPTPQDPELDISFGTPQYFAYPIERMTNANLYNRFYRNQLQILERGKMLKAKFRLTTVDILNLQFNEKIWLLESWWNINRIIDWDANKPGLTQVELVSAESGLPSFIPGQFTIESSSASRYYGKAAEKPYGKNEYGPGTSNIRIFGKDNLIHERTGNTIVIGDRNTARGKTQIVLGDGNQVSGERVAVLGVKGQRFDESDRIYMTTPVIISPFISAGRDEVLSAYPDAKVVNLVSGSRDEVRELGTHSIENLIFSGKDRV
jgi:hypothetical protein